MADETPTPELVTTVGGRLPVNPISFGISIIGTIISAIIGIFGIGSGGDVKALTQQVNQFASEVTAAFDALKRFALTVAAALGALLQAFHDTLVTFVHALWDEFKKVVAALGKLVAEGLCKVLQAVRNIRTVLNAIYQNYIRPVLAWLQLARKYLAILRALHVPFAAQLDNIIARIQGKILYPWLYVLRSINGVGNWVNVILSAAGMIQRAIFIRTMFAYQSDWVNMWWAGQAGALGGNPPWPPSAPPVPQSDAAALADLQAFALLGTGPVAQDAASAVADLQAELASV